MSALRISARFRVALALKGLMLAALAAAFAAIARTSLAAAVVSTPIAAFLAWASWLGFGDAVGGEAVRESGARPLASRWTGRSLRAPSGRFVEFVLWNPWQALDPAATYTVTYGARSGVLVEPPQPDATTLC